MRRSRSRFGLGCWPVLRLRSWPVLRLRLGLNRTVLRLLWPGLRLDWSRLLGLDGAHLRLLRLNGAHLRLSRSGFRLRWPDLGLGGADFGLSRTYLRLAGADWLYLWPVVWFSWTEPWL